MKFSKHALVASSLALVFGVNLFADEVYTIQNKTLKEALEIISKKSNLSYIANDEILERKYINNIENIEGTQQALDKILEGTGLKAVIQNEAIVIVKEKVEGKGTVLEAISVNDSYKRGSVENGYLVEETSDIGPWKGKSLQDTPLAINVMTSELFENLQATSTDAIYNINPTAQTRWNQAQNNNGYVMLRGFSSSTAAFDGIRREKWQFTHNTNPEEYEKLETITGLSGFLYGPASIGGIMNYIPKRPTLKPEHSITVGNAGGKSGYYSHVDLGGPLTENGKLGYRLNAVSQDNDTHVEHQSVERKLVNLALDYRVTDNLLIQGTVSDSDYRLDGRQPYWYLAKGATRPSASSIDSNKLWAQKWAYNDGEVRRYSTNILWNINDNIAFRSAYMNEKITREGLISSNTIQADGTYTQVTTNSAGSKQDMYGYGAYAFVDFDFDTASINHQLTMGMQTSDAYRNDQNPDIRNSKITLTGLNFDSPVYISAPVVAPVVSKTDNRFHMTSKNFTIGDSIQLNPQWALIVGANYVQLKYEEDDYKKSELTPSVSLVYKPIENLSLYSSYMEGLELGGIAADTYGGYDVINARKAMDPLMSEQIEVGAKLTLGDTLLTVAIFEIDKGLEYYDVTDITKPTYVQDGRQVHKGIEFTATGKITDNLTAITGITLLDPKTKENKNNPLLEGKRPQDVADKFAKLYLEYSPFDTMDLAFNSGINYTGSFYGDNLNTDKIPSYTLVDFGARYTTKATTYPLTFRVNVNNAFDRDYWINSNYLGDKRTIHASVQMKF
ncbi:TonB-dependent siderophore receptor [Aliarcobacter butzleri]|uniref:TonB-dependent siderophore receptor n=1 Tax=Aliarcobacter butzleri TaxID=28197 RepID=UPI003B217FAD